MANNLVNLDILVGLWYSAPGHWLNCTCCTLFVAHKAALCWHVIELPELGLCCVARGQRCGTAVAAAAALWGHDGVDAMARWLK